MACRHGSVCDGKPGDEMTQRTGTHSVAAGLVLMAALCSGMPPTAAASSITQLAAATSALQVIEELEELDEVVVHGTRLQDRINQAEDRFFKLYNELNKDDDFNINCAYVALDPDSRIQSRLCTPSFFVNAITETYQWAERCTGTQDEEGNYVPPPPCYTPPDPGLVLAARSDEYARNIMSVIKSDPRLQAMAGELDDLHLERAQLSRRYQQIKTAADEARPEVKHRPKIR